MTKPIGQTAPPAVTDELVLPDESDRIISDLRSQLNTLQRQLSAYERKDSAAPGPAAASGAGGHPPESGHHARDWSSEWAPDLAERLNAPAQELTTRLERVISEVHDPNLRLELERCLETAFYLFATFRHISDNHRMLLGSLEETHARMNLGALREQLQAALAAQGTAAVPDAAGSWPDGDTLVPESIVSVAATVARIAEELIGKVIRVTLDVERSRAGRLAGDGICITIACAGAKEELRALDRASQLVFRPGVSAITVVDWLYMEKIVELQGGALRLYHRGDRAAGFQVRLPLEPPADRNVPDA